MPVYSKHRCANAFIEFKLHECIVRGAKQPNSAANGTMHMEVALTQPCIYGQIWIKDSDSPREIQGSDYAKSEKIYENKSRWDLVTSTTYCSTT